MARRPEDVEEKWKEGGQAPLLYPQQLVNTEHLQFDVTISLCVAILCCKTSRRKSR